MTIGNSEDVIRSFIIGGKVHRNKTKSLFIENDVLYSYRYRHPLCIKTEYNGGDLFIVNEDDYSLITNTHCNAVHEAVRDERSTTVSMYAFASLCGDISTAVRVIKHEINIIDFWEDDIRWATEAHLMRKVAVPRKDETGMVHLTYDIQDIVVKKTGEHPSGPGWHRSVKNYTPFGCKTLRDIVQELNAEVYGHTVLAARNGRTPPSTVEIRYTKRYYYHRPAHVLFSWGRDVFLAGMDEGEYFITQLPGESMAINIRTAMQALKPHAVRHYEDTTGAEAHRQGEWFFVPISDKWPVATSELARNIEQLMMTWPGKRLYRVMEKNFVLPREDDDNNAHIATRGMKYNNMIIVSGRIRHEGHHKMLVLSNYKSPQYFLAYKNTAVDNWSASGNVD